MEKTETKYCKHCGQLIPIDAVICTHCGRQVEELHGSAGQPIVINNSASSSASASASSSTPARQKKKYSLLLDIFLLIITGGLWVIWMIIRPKYEY